MKRSTYRLHPAVIDRAKDRLGFSSDEQLAVHLEMSSGTIARIRRGETPGFATAIKLLDAADCGIPAGIQRIDVPAVTA